MYTLIHDSIDTDLIFTDNIETACAANNEGYGVFRSANPYKGPRRVSNLTSIDYWFCEVDYGDKDTMLSALYAYLMPTRIVETKRGYHAYWAAKDATLEKWSAVVRDGLVKAYGADPHSTDVLRLLRVPGFFHMKDPANPFLVKVVHEDKSLVYSESDMLLVYRQAPAAKSKTKEQKPRKDGFWGHVHSLDTQEVLTKLSGSELVRGEVFTFHPQANGHINVRVNGKNCSAFINKKDILIASGGAGVVNWCLWYGNTLGQISRAFKELFPVELGEVKHDDEQLSITL